MLDNWNDSFAKTQLEKYGWKKGDGLGKNKHGNTKHITVKVKNDTKGIGGNQQQWDFAWWDHLYNKSASSVTVEKDESKEIKVAVKKKSAERRSKTGIISTHRPTGTTTTTTSSMASIAEEQNLMDSVKSVHSSMAQTIARTSLYSGFVKSSSVLIGTDTQKDNDKENDEEDDEQKDYSIKMTDEELFAACEGRTARKGGRGLVEQKGKYARVMQDYIHKRDATDDEEQDNDKKRKREDKDEKASSSSKKKAKKDKKDKDEKALTSSKKKEKKEKKKDKKDKKEKKKKAKKEKK